MVTMVTRLWDYNFPKINPDTIGVEMNVNFAGPLNKMFEQKAGCNFTTTVSLFTRADLDIKIDV